MADPLSLLRQYNINKKEIIERDGQIIFGEFSWPKNVNQLSKIRFWKEGRTEGVLHSRVFVVHSKCGPSAFGVCPTGRLPRTYRRSIVRIEREPCNISTVKRILVLVSIKVPRWKFDANQASRRIGWIRQLGKKGPVRGYTGAEGEGTASGSVRLNKKEASVNIDNIKSLSEPCRWRRLLLLKRNVWQQEGHNQTYGQRRCNGRGTLRVILDFDVDSTKDIVSRERQWRTRTTILQSNGKIFAKNIFAILQSIKNREEGRGRPQAQPVKLPEPPRVIRPQPQPTQYNRYDQERFNRQKEETEGFKIDTMGTYHGMSLKLVTQGSAGQNKAQQNSLNNNNSSSNNNLSGNMPPGRPKELIPTAQARLLAQNAANKRTSRTPIIIIPAATTSLITMYNARDVLQDLKFVTTDEKKRGGSSRENEVLIQRQKAGNLTVPYRVIDNPSKLTAHDWNRVVAVFVMGPAWQFKGWPWDGNPVEIFAKIAAFHLRYDDLKLDANVAKWAVTVLNISRTKRHLDKACLMAFWEKLDLYMTKYKPDLRF
uniref:Parafibromin n=1 Tax=Anopheles funestus TaxID=62324 RepID=A0A182RUP8_ANOFN